MNSIETSLYWIFDHCDCFQGWIVASDSVPPTNTPGQPTTYTVTNLKPDTTYVFQVRARNSHGIGVPSELSDPINTRCKYPRRKAYK